MIVNWVAYQEPSRRPTPIYLKVHILLLLLHPLRLLLAIGRRPRSLVPASLQALHLPQLQFAEILLAQVHSADLVTHRVGGDVLLGPLLEAAGLLHGFLEHRLVGLSDAAEAEVHSGSNLLDLDSGELLSASSCLDGVDSQVDRGLDLFTAGLLLCADGHDVLKSFHVNLVCGLAFEEVQEHALGESVLVGDGALESSSGEKKHGLQTNGKLLGLELRNRSEALRVKSQLQHIQNLETKSSHKRQGVRALLLAASKDHQAGVVLLGEELEGSGISEGVDGVLLSELLGERLTHLVEVVQGILDNLRAGCAAEEEAGLGILDRFGLTLLESSL